MPIDTGTSTALTVIKAPEPTSIVCPSCKLETGIKKEEIIERPLLEDFHCPFCDAVLFSLIPEVRPAYSGGAWTRGDWGGEYD